MDDCQKQVLEVFCFLLSSDMTKKKKRRWLKTWIGLGCVDWNWIESLLKCSYAAAWWHNPRSQVQTICRTQVQQQQCSMLKMLGLHGWTLPQDFSSLHVLRSHWLLLFSEVSSSFQIFSMLNIWEAMGRQTCEHHTTANLSQIWGSG